jgi:hypothetical protein
LLPPVCRAETHAVRLYIPPSKKKIPSSISSASAISVKIPINLQKKFALILCVENFFYTFGALYFIETYTCFIEFIAPMFIEPMFTEPKLAGCSNPTARAYFFAPPMPPVPPARGASARSGVNLHNGVRTTETATTTNLVVGWEVPRYARYYGKMVNDENLANDGKMANDENLANDGNLVNLAISCVAPLIINHYTLIINLTHTHTHTQL